MIETGITGTLDIHACSWHRVFMMINAMSGETGGQGNGFPYFFYYYFSHAVPWSRAF
ncbi:MAG: hypothetical protein LBF83_10495 [Spirochaetaceae bacterium]|jgi:hypothetical protein|nr:hypothetical protein [Spirochaetaceae bacterium]